MSIEQADKIIGIDIALGLGGILDQVDERHRQSYRRGAYIEWIATQDESLCTDELLKRGSRNYRVGMMQLDKIAEAIVAIHAATQPKGDGLPEEFEVFCQIGASGAIVSVMKRVAGLARDMDASEQRKLSDYLTRCLSKPVRRLLAEFEVTDQAPKAYQAAITICDPTSEKFCPPVVCWLVPKSRKD